MIPPDPTPWVVDDPKGLPVYDPALPGFMSAGEGGGHLWSPPFDGDPTVGAGKLLRNGLQSRLQLVFEPAEGSRPITMAEATYDDGVNAEAGVSDWPAISTSYHYVTTGANSSETMAVSQAIDAFDVTGAWGLMDQMRASPDWSASPQQMVTGYHPSLLDPDGLTRRTYDVAIEWLEPDPTVTVQRWELDLFPPDSQPVIALDASASAANIAAGRGVSYAVGYNDDVGVAPASFSWASTTAQNMMVPLGGGVDLLSYLPGVDYTQGLDPRLGAIIGDGVYPFGGMVVMYATPEQYNHLIPSPPGPTGTSYGLAQTMGMVRTAFRVPPFRIWTRPKTAEPLVFPLRQKQRNDGMLRGVARARSTSSIQNSVRQNSYR